MDNKDNRKHLTDQQIENEAISQGTRTLGSGEFDRNPPVADAFVKSFTLGAQWAQKQIYEPALEDAVN